MSTIVIDGLNEEDFRRSIENRLREGMAGVAIERLRRLLASCAGPGGILPERFLTVEPGDLVLVGWDGLGDALRRRDLPGRMITAISIAFAWPEEGSGEPDGDGRLRPHVETSYFSDNAWPFSQSLRDDLLEGYSVYGCTWSGDAEAVDNALGLEGIDDLHGALASLEARLLASDEPDEEGIRAGSLGACLLSALLVQAVSERIAQGGLPRPLCVMAGSNGVYPYFDAPVAGMSEAARKAAEAEAEAVIEPSNEAIYGAIMEVPVPRYSSLLVTGIPRGRKRPALVLSESEEDLTERLARLRSLTHGDGDGDGGDGDELPASGPTPDMPAPGPGELTPVAAGASPLLVKKPGGQAWDFRELLGPPPGQSEAPEPEAPQRIAPAPPPVREEAPPPLPGPALAMLEPDLQQRLQRLLSGESLPLGPLPRPEEPGEPERPGLLARLRGWLSALAGKFRR